MNSKHLHRLAPLLLAILFGVAAYLIHRELAAYHLDEIRSSLAQLPGRQIGWALALTLASYLVLIGYDFMALRYIEHPLPFLRVGLASFLGYVMSHNIGLSLLGASAPRYRIYTASGLSPFEVAKVVAFTGTTLWIGWFAMIGVVLLFHPHALPLPIAGVILRPLGGACVALVAFYLLLTATRKTPIQLGSWTFRAPAMRLAATQLVVSVLDWVVASSVLYVLLPEQASVSYETFLSMYLLAVIAGLVSHVPGGLGVFESIMMIALRPFAPGPALVGSLLAYRAVYYLLPLAVAAVLFAIHETVQRRQQFKTAAALLERWAPALVPRVVALTTFAGGVVLLMSGATPAIDSRLAWLEVFLPLPVLELSHLLGSLAGVGLLLLANGLQRRLDAAYHLAVALLGAGIVLSLLKGFDYEEALLLAVLLASLVPCRRHFHRHASLIRQRFTPEWLAAIGLAVAGSIWLGFFAHKHVQYSHDLWWEFAVNGDAPRFLRATVGVVGAMVVVGVARLLRPAPAPTVRPSADDLAVVRDVVSASTSAAAHLALLGDKSFLFNESRRAFIMYAVEGRSWIAMGDPVGPKEDWPELLWRFRELCDQYDDWPVFYEARAEHLPRYLDIGLTPLKFGEEAQVSLCGFSLEGSARKDMRQVLRRVEREGGSFDIIQPEGVPGILGELEPISDAWLEAKQTREKAFSLGFFDPGYLSRFPIAVVRRNGCITAFANLWCSADNEEFAPDLMRYGPQAPQSAMEYLFIQLMVWGAAQGYRWLNLGMAPLAGLEDHALASFWHRMGAFAFQHGERFYNFQGLRLYKQKFDPQWRPKYLVSPGGLALPRVLANVASLVSRGLKGALGK